MLGHHAIKDKSLACYSRDLLSRPLRDLCAMLLNIRRGYYNPDGTRSGYMKEVQEVHMGKTATRAGEAPHSPVSVVPSPSLAEEFQEAAPAKEADPSASRAFLRTLSTRGSMEKLASRSSRKARLFTQRSCWRALAQALRRVNAPPRQTKRFSTRSLIAPSTVECLKPLRAG